MGTTQGRGAAAPIGIFDSGVGGLTVARAVLEQLPHEAILCIGDTAHSPYGPLPIGEGRRHAPAVVDDVAASGVTMLVVSTAEDVYRVLTRADLLRDEQAPPPEHRFLATGDPEPFARSGRRLLGLEIGSVVRAESVGVA